MTFLDDLDVIDTTTIEKSGPLYVMGQWHNGDQKLAAVGGVAHTGGLLIDRKYVPDNVKPAPGWADVSIVFSSGKASPMLAAAQPKLAVIRTRFCWIVRSGSDVAYLPRTSYQAGRGMRGKLQVLCGVAGYNFPVVFTFTGKASQEFEKLLTEFGKQVGVAVAQTGKGPFPRFAFYLKLAPGAHSKVGEKGQESTITPPTWARPSSEVDSKYLEAAYVGREALLLYQAEYHNAAEWASAWDRPGAEENADTAEWDNHPDALPQRQPSQSAAQAAGLGGSSRNAPPPPDNWEDF